VEVLAMLLERPGELVTREQLNARLWPNGTIVEFDHGINSSIRRLRAALNDSAEQPRYTRLYPSAAIGSSFPMSPNLGRAARSKRRHRPNTGSCRNLGPVQWAWFIGQPTTGLAATWH
jgi:hypothetical protein